MEEVVQIVADIFATQDSDYWVEKMVANDIAHEKVGHFKDVLTDEQAWANDYLIKYTYPSGDECIFPAAPVDFASYPERPFVEKSVTIREIFSKLLVTQMPRLMQ